MAEASSARRQRVPLRVLLLSLVVLGHFLCSVCHGAVAAADTPADEDQRAVAVQSAQPAQPAVGAAVLHGLDEDGRSDCATAGDAGFDQRTAAATGLFLLGLSAAVLVAALRPPPRPQLGIVRWLPTAVRSRAPLFLTLCIQRV
ncbi:MAG: hypothetical protein M0026_03900 [Nocardiopsaceae bacterium]|nr:hypothetical protein [Nocardiopsaceae bacterium]